MSAVARLDRNIEPRALGRDVQKQPLVVDAEDIGVEEVLNIAVERLNQVAIFTPLAGEEIERLANSSNLRVYAPGEAIVRLGREGNSMFVIIRGAVRVEIPSGAASTVVNELRENDFFGEMSLLTGEPRSANVIAQEETEVLQIKKEALKPIFEDNPTLVESISEIIAERKELLHSHSSQSDGSAQKDPSGVLSSIKRFFGLR